MGINILRNKQIIIYLEFYNRKKFKIKYNLYKY